MTGMARSIWSGSISFGLVNIPINLFSATESHRVAFHEFQRGTGERVRYRRVAEGSGEEVPWDQIEKGFEVEKGRFVVLTDDELKAAEPERTSTVEIERFVPLDEIDPVSWDQTYYVGADGAAAAKAYGLLREAMAGRHRVAIGRFVMRTKEYVVCLRPYENILALQTMFFPDEVRATQDIDAPSRKVAVGKSELALAGQLIESLSGHWDPSKYQDSFRERVMELVRKKGKGEEIAAAPAKEHGKVLDLMAALKATLAAGKAGRGKRRGGGGGAVPRSLVRDGKGAAAGVEKADDKTGRRASRLAPVGSGKPAARARTAPGPRTAAGSGVAAGPRTAAGNRRRVPAATRARQAAREA